MASAKAVVGIVMGSENDLDVMKRCSEQLDALGVRWEMRVMSAHRTPKVVCVYAESAAGRGLKVLIAGAGMSAALAGTLAAHTTLPVIGVPLASGALGGLDAALSTMQMPPGVPVACVAIGAAGATNAAVLAAQVLALADAALGKRLVKFKLDLAAKVADKDAELFGKK